ncbi:MAG: hypothetical protein JWQ87_2291 [Candidatus Sulfotelmatobacter sp.]|nr:hypothetical protein [Candidatus Sulfotelmatobacter sp.]
MELVGVNSIVPDLKTIAAIGEIDDPLRKTALLVALKDSLEQWLHQNNPPTLGQLLIQGSLRPNALFTHYSNYFCKGSGQATEALRKGKPIISQLEAYSKLDEYRPGQRVTFRFHHEHLTSNSAWTELTGQRRLLILGAATSITDQTIDAIPWVIAHPLPGLFEKPSPVGSHWATRLEVFIDVIDNFARVRNIEPPSGKRDLDVLRAIPEEEIKKAFAEIIGEPTIPKDWGGERSDLFTTWVKLDGKRISTAFAFKGPAQFHPMTAADLGKNGDQIDRLFSEPADLLILQHCHEITPPVRGMMRAYAQQMGKPRLFCLINGYDTIRILQAYGKCGLPMPKKHVS